MNKTNVIGTLVLLANSQFDKQRSMKLYLEMVLSFLKEKPFRIKVLTPPTASLFLRLRPHQGLGKWLSYFEKFFLFPIHILLFRFFQLFKTSPCVFHVLDHSNSLWSLFLNPDRCIVTCHDMIAIKGGLGDESVRCKSSRLGSYLQKLILFSLKRCPNLIFVSNSTKSDFLSISGRKDNSHYMVVYHGLNQSLEPVHYGNSEVFEDPYFLHVGSNLPRKNRDILAKLMAISKGKIRMVWVGPEPDSFQYGILEENQVVENLVWYSNVNEKFLSQLYSRALALILPSFSEGFGWPILEASFLRCKLILSDIPIHREISNNQALFFKPDDVNDLFLKVTEFLRTGNDVISAPESINCKWLQRFDKTKIANEYIEKYKSVFPLSS